MEELEIETVRELIGKIDSMAGNVIELLNDSEDDLDNQPYSEFEDFRYDLEMLQEKITGIQQSYKWI